MTPRRIDPEAAVRHLRAADPVMARVIDAVGPFAMRIGDGDPFRALARAIVAQQISGAAAASILARLADRLLGSGAAAPAVRRTDPGWDGAAAPFPTPAQVLAASDAELAAAGLSRQKILALRDLARHFAEGELAAARFEEWDDETVIARLTQVRGIGRWTAEMFLMFHLGRPDVLPVDDLGIRRAVRRRYGLQELPRPAELRAIAAPWRPWATVACWYLWRSEAVMPPGG